jgi:hypothetical protein
MHHLYRQMLLFQMLQHLPLLEETQTTPGMTVRTASMMMVMILMMSRMMRTPREMCRATMARATSSTTTATLQATVLVLLLVFTPL